MVLDRIIEMELEFLKRSRVPTRVFLNIANYNALISELDENRYFQVIHNMKIEIVKSTQVVVI